MNIKIDVNINASPELIGALQALATLATGVAAQLAPATTAPQTVPPSPPTVVPTNGHSSPSPVPVPTPTPTPVPAPVPTSTQTYTLEQLAVAATPLADAGRRNDLVGLLNSFGVSALTQLPKEHYGAFATQLRAMGAKI